METKGKIRRLDKKSLMKILVLYGGVSNERKISLLTGNAILKSLSKKYSVHGYDFNGDYDNIKKIVTDFDLVFNALHGGEGENGIVQNFFEKNNIKYTGSSSNAAKIAMNKHLAKEICFDNSIKTPDWIYFTESLCIDKVARFNSKSIVVKPADEGSSIGLSIIKNFDDGNKSKISELNLAVEKCKNVSENILIEEYIAGREVTVGILGNMTLPILEIIPENFYYDYECKYLKGKSHYVVPAKIDKNIENQLKNLSLKIFNLLNCANYGRIDYRISEDNKIYFLEINTLPGFTETSLFPKAAKAISLDYDKLLEKIILLAKK